MAVATIENITIVYPALEDMIHAERIADGQYRIYDGRNWRFYLNSKERALELAAGFGGVYVAKANWDEETLTTSYSELERV